MSPGQVQAKNHLTVIVWDLGLRNENTRNADHAHSVDMTEVGHKKRRYSFEKQETDGNAHARQK